MWVEKTINQCRGGVSHLNGIALKHIVKNFIAFLELITKQMYAKETLISYDTRFPIVYTVLIQSYQCLKIPNESHITAYHPDK